MSIIPLFQKLKTLGITLSADGQGGLVVKGNKSNLTKPLISEIFGNKMNILQWLEQKNARAIIQISRRPQGQKHEVLSFAQQRMWFLDKLHANSVYSMPVCYRYDGTLQLEHLNTALRQVIARHEIIRTVYVESEGSVYQKVLPEAECHFQVRHFDKTEIDWERESNYINAFIDEQVNHPFDLTSDIMLRVIRVQRSPQQGILLFNSHHIASDGWSIKVLIKEVFQLYQGTLSGMPVTLPDLPIQYADYARWQRDYLSGERFQQQMNYWKNNLSGVDPVHSIPLDKVRPAQKKHHGKNYAVVVDAKVTQRLMKLADDNKLSFFMLLQGSLALQIASHSNNPDVVMATPVANRLQPEIKELIGLFANTLVLRTQASQETLSDYLKHILQTHNGAQACQDIPFEQLVEALNLPRTVAHNPLAQILVTLQSEQEQRSMVEESGFETQGLVLSQGYSGSLHSRFDLEICFNVSKEGITTNWLFDISLFEKQHIAQLADNFNVLLQQLAQVNDANEIQLSSLTLPQASEIAQIQQYLTGTSVDSKNDLLANVQVIHEIVEHFAIRSPDATAVECGGETLSFALLNHMANKVSAALCAQKSQQPQALVGMCIKPSLDMIVAILGILKSRAAYVPLDPNYPVQRLHHILADASIETLIVQNQFHSIPVPEGIHTFSVKQLLEASENVELIQPEVAGHDLAYVIYTSGTSGKPKGVAVEHKQVIHYLSMAQEYLSADIEKSLLSTSIAFDATVTTLFGSWLQGKPLSVVPATEEPTVALQNALQSPDNCLFKLTPSQLQTIKLSNVINSQHVIVVGGEVFPRRLAGELVKVLPNSVFVNEYGPTETSVGCCYQIFDASRLLGMSASQSVPIGKPGAGVTCLILDAKGQVLPIGSVGELYIGGGGVARGYLHQPELTKEKFIVCPEHLKKLTRDCDRLYRSGDRVRYKENGVLEFLGRVDEQIKLRGYRIEPGEIEHYLNQHPQIDSSIVRPLDDEQRLVAYLKLAHPSENHADVARQLIQFLAENLPAYMVPGQFYIVQDWQLTANGKIDFGALSEAVLAIDNIKYQAPQTDTERKLLRVWAELLGMDDKYISTTANFFELGGHSLAMVNLSYQISQVFEVEQPELKELLATPTIVGIARLIDFETGDKFIEIATDDIVW